MQSLKIMNIIFKIQPKVTIMNEKEIKIPHKKNY